PERKRLGEIIVRPGLEPSHAVVEGIECRQHQDRGRAAPAPQLPTEVEAGAAGEPNVQDDHVERARPRPVAAFGEGRGQGRIDALRAPAAAPLALQHARRPKQLLTVFAGQDAAATERARSYFTGYPPSSPQMGLFTDGRLVFMLERKNIEGRPAQDIADDLTAAFDRYCG